MLNLTDMWRAAGCPEYRRPIHWLVLEETPRFRAHAETHWTEPDEPVSPNIIQDDIIRLDPDGFVATARGRHGGTWAHWQLALAYARYLSPAVPPLVQHRRPRRHGAAGRPARGGQRPAAGAPRPALPRPASPVRHARAARGGPDVPAALRAGAGAGQPAGVHRAEPEHHHQGGGGRALRGPVPLLRPRARSHRGRPSRCPAPSSTTSSIAA